MKPKILVIGDVIIDRYLFCEDGKPNPESDAPLLSLQKEQIIYGGAANVANGLVKLGADVWLCAVVDGNYPHGVNASLSIISKQVTTKTRIYRNGVNIARIDNDVISSHNFELYNLYQFDLIIISDYAKGVCTAELCQQAINSGKKVIVDPKGDDYSKYDGAYLIKPNAKELTNPIHHGNCDYMFVTDAEKSAWVYKGELQHECTPYPSNVKDVTGAGDTVMATLGYFIALGHDILESCELAMKAAAISIEHIGNYNPTLKEIYDRRDN